MQLYGWLSFFTLTSPTKSQKEVIQTQNRLSLTNIRDIEEKRKQTQKRDLKMKKTTKTNEASKLHLWPSGSIDYLGMNSILWAFQFPGGEKSPMAL